MGAKVVNQSLWDKASFSFVAMYMYMYMYVLVYINCVYVNKSTYKMSPEQC
jgi:hypothetical protein